VLKYIVLFSIGGGCTKKEKFKTQILWKKNL